MNNRKNTLAYNRFKKFLKKVKEAQTDEEILMAGYNLVEEYRGFHYNWLSTATKEIITDLAEDLKN